MGYRVTQLTCHQERKLFGLEIGEIEMAVELNDEKAHNV